MQPEASEPRAQFSLNTEPSAKDFGIVESIRTAKDPDLVRATRLGEVLRMGASIMASSKGSEETFALSLPTKRIDEFISHNWNVRRWGKFLALTLHYNSERAIISASAAAAAIIVCTALGSNPLVMASTCGFWDQSCDRSLLGVLIVGPAAFLTFCFSGDIMHFFGWGPSVFLDKVCIHQTNPERMVLGIQSLGAMLCQSDQITIIYTDYYFRKLWTMYEFATVLLLTPETRVAFISRFEALFTMVAMVVQWLNLFPLSAARLAAAQGLATSLSSMSYLLVVVAWSAAFLVCRGWSAHFQRTLQHVEQFDVRGAACFMESDRVLVENNIESMMRVILGMGEATRDETLDAFNALVSKQVGPSLRSAFGRMGISYKTAILLGLPVLGWSADAIGTALLHGDGALHVCVSFTWLLARWLVESPLMLGWSMSCARIFLFRGRCAATGLCLLSVLGVFVLYGLNGFLHTRALGDVTSAAVFLIVLTAEAIVVAKLYQTPKSQPPDLSCNSWQAHPQADAIQILPITSVERHHQVKGQSAQLEDDRICSEEAQFELSSPDLQEVWTAI